MSVRRINRRRRSVGLSQDLHGMPVFMVPEHTNKPPRVRRPTSVDPPGIASILLFEGEVPVEIEIHRGDVASRDPSRIRGDLKIVGSPSPECQRPIEGMSRLIITANSCDVESHAIWARTAGEKCLCEDVRDLHPRSW